MIWRKPKQGGNNMAHPSAGPNPQFPATGMRAWAKVGRWWKKATVVKVPKMGEIVDKVRRSGESIKCAIYSPKQASVWVKADLIIPRDQALNGADKPE